MRPPCCPRRVPGREFLLEATVRLSPFFLCVLSCLPPSGGFSLIFPSFFSCLFCTSLAAWAAGRRAPLLSPQRHCSPCISLSFSLMISFSFPSCAVICLCACFFFSFWTRTGDCGFLPPLSAASSGARRISFSPFLHKSPCKPSSPRR